MRFEDLEHGTKARIGACQSIMELASLLRRGKTGCSKDLQGLGSGRDEGREASVSCADAPTIGILERVGQIAGKQAACAGL